MPATLIDGKSLAAALLAEQKSAIASLAARGVRPGLAAILAGDVDFAAVREIAGSITPVPGGGGPMTVTMWIVNTVRAAELSLE